MIFGMNIKICILAEDYPSHDRPVFVFVQQLVEELVDQGVQISVVAPQSLTRSVVRRIPLMPKCTEYKTKKNNVYRVYRPYSISFGNGHKFLYKIANVFNESAINEVLKKIKPEVLYGHFWHTAYKLKKFAIDNHKPLFVACGEGDDALENLVSSLSSKEKTEFANAVCGVISVSSENKRKCIVYELAKEHDIIVLPNSVDTSIFVKDDARDIRKELGVLPNDFLISFTGAFIHRKGSARLSAAIDKLNDSRIKSIFIGAPLDGDNSTPTCEGIVHKGRLEHDDIPQYLYASDCFCLPTLNEGCSNAIVEAVAAGLPIISSDLPFNEDILDESNSILVDPQNVDQIADAIKKLMTNVELCKSMSASSFEKANNLRIDKRATAIIEFIESKIKK